VGRVGVALDLLIRVAVIVVAAMLIHEFWSERVEPNGDGVPVRLLIGPLMLYVGWNVRVMVRSVRAWRVSTLSGASFLTSVGLLSFARLLWLLPLADDLWWRHRQPLTVIIAASVVCTILALGDAIARSIVRPIRT
jgi:hypothetical protein